MILIPQGLQEVFLWLIRSSFQATILLGLILLIRLLVGRRFHFRMVYCLWILLLLRLIWPLNLQTTFSVFNLIPRHMGPDHYLSSPAAEESQSGEVAVRSPLSEPAAIEKESLSQDMPVVRNLSAEKTETGESAAALNDPMSLLCTVWLIGAGLLGGWVLLCNFRLWRIVKAERLVTRQGILELLEDCKRELGLQTVIGIVETDKVTTPCLFGYLRPRLLLPMGILDEVDGRELRYVFLHELGHLKRHDILIGWLMAVVQVLHWFNPAVWFAMGQIGRDRELACDELALSHLDDNESKAYGATILSFLERFARQQKVPAMAGIAENQSLLKRRIMMIAQFKNRKISWIPVLAIVLILLATTFTSSQSQLSATTQAVSGDGTTSGGLQAMIDAAEAGSTVLIPDGVYTDPITISKPLVLKGEKCVFEVTADQPAIFIDTVGKEASLEGITIKWQLATSGQHEYPFAVAVKDTNATIKNCVFRSLGDPQRSPVGVRAMGFSTMTLTDCDFTGFDYVVCYGEGTKGKMEGCFIRNCGHQGVILYSGANAEVVGNIITGSRYHAVRSTGGMLRMKDNLIINNKNRGVYLGNKSSQGVITNNLLIGNATGIDGISASRYQVMNNVILNSDYAAISAVPQAQLDIQGNVLMNNTRGIIVQQKEGQVDPVRSKWANNVYWNNKADTENCNKGDGAVEAQPDFIDAAGGNYKMTDAAFKNMGLQEPETLYYLWKKYKEKM